jgi:pimeloyl-ACP methyl ester carboxylesterase
MERAFSTWAFVDAVERSMDAAGFDLAHLVGNSLGVRHLRRTSVAREVGLRAWRRFPRPAGARRLRRQLSYEVTASDLVTLA